MYGINNVRRLAAAAAIAASFGLASPALGQTTTPASNIAVSATVTSNCTLSTSALAFGNVSTLSGTNVDATGGITVTCTNGTAWSAAANAGLGSGASMLTRRMTAGANTLAYTLYTSSSYGTVWGDGTGTTGRITNTGTGTSQAITIYGRIPAGQASVPAGDYFDTVAVTVTY